MTKPKPIKTAPKDGTRVLAYWPDTDTGGAYGNSAWVETWYGPGNNSDCWQSPFEWGEIGGPTHWLPLPPKPESAR